MRLDARRNVIGDTRWWRKRADRNKSLCEHKTGSSGYQAAYRTTPPRRELVVALVVVVMVRIWLALLFAWLAGGLVWARAWHMQPATGGIVPFVGESLLL